MLAFDPLIFDPVLYSIEENQFLLDHLGEPPVVALRVIPPTVVPAAVSPAIHRVYELCELEKHNKTPWAGLEAVKDSIKVYLREAKRWEDEKRLKRGAPEVPLDALV
jgi:hypothetical protein